MFQYIPSIIVSALVLLIFYFLLLIFEPFITALILSAVVVILFYPVHLRISRVFSNGWASLVSAFLVFMIVIVPGLLIAAGIVNEAVNLGQTLKPASFEKIMTHAYSWAAKFGIDIDVVIKEGTQKFISQAGLLASHILSNVWYIFLGIVTTLLATFFFFRDGEKAIKFARSLPLNLSWCDKLFKELVTMIKSNIAAAFITASIQGTIGGLAFAWLDIPAPILWGTVMGFFSLFPYIGAWLVWIPAAVGLILAGRIWDAVLLALIGAAIVNPVDNILRPAIIASATNLNGLLVFIAYLGGVQAFGLSGLLLGPMILIFVTGLLKSLQSRIS